MNRVRGGRSASAWATAGLIAALGLLVITPAAFGAGVQPNRTTTLAPPYHGWAQYQVTHTTDLCGTNSARSKITKTSFFVFATGSGGFSAQTAASSCPSGASSGAFTDENLAVYLPIRFHAGHPTITVNGSYAMNGDLALKAGTCALLGPGRSYCDRMAVVDAFVDAYFVDLTTSSVRQIGYAGFYNDSYSDSYCYAGNCTNFTSGAGGTLGAFSLSSTFSFVYTVGKKMVSTEQYAVEISADGETLSECSATNFAVTKCSASASLNYATGGDGFQVASVLVK